MYVVRGREFDISFEWELVAGGGHGFIGGLVDMVGRGGDGLMASVHNLKANIHALMNI